MPLLPHRRPVYRILGEKFFCVSKFPPELFLHPIFRRNFIHILIFVPIVFFKGTWRDAPPPPLSPPQASPAATAVGILGAGEVARTLVYLALRGGLSPMAVLWTDAFAGGSGPLDFFYSVIFFH